MSEAIVTLRKNTNDLFSANLDIQSWKEEEKLYIGKSSGYDEAIANGIISKINITNAKGELVSRYALNYNDQQITSGNAKLVDVKTGEVKNMLFHFSEKGIVFKGNVTLNAPFVIPA
jgi:hypothetical protein